MKLERGLSLPFLAFLGVTHAQEKQPGYWGFVGAGYIYQTSESPTGNWPSSNGWYVLPTFNMNKQVCMFADFANFHRKGHNIHVQLFGAFHEFSNRTRLTPFVFTGIGSIRDSNVSNSFAWFAGGGYTVRLTRRVAFKTIPVEYVLNTANGGNNCVARPGFVQHYSKTLSELRPPMKDEVYFRGNAIRISGQLLAT